MTPDDILKQVKQTHSLASTLLIAKACIDNPELIAALIKLIKSNENILSQRASWPLSHIAAQNPAILKPYVPRLIEIVQQQGLHQAAYRNALKALSLIEIKEKYQAKLLSLAYQIITNETIPVANRVYAIEIVFNISKAYKELLDELEMILITLSAHESPGIRSKVKNTLKVIKKARK